MSICDKCGKEMDGTGHVVPLRYQTKYGRRYHTKIHYKRICYMCNRDLTDLLEFHKKQFFKKVEER